MKNISDAFSELYTPFKAILIYKGENRINPERPESENQIYVESYDIGHSGNPVNAHPLSVREMSDMAELLQNTRELKNEYLKSEGLMPVKVLHINPKGSGSVIWHSPSQSRKLYFQKDLSIPNGIYKIPAMLWKAGKDSLSVFALKDNKRPNLDSVLYHAPFFNIYENGSVCMGTVNVKIEIGSCLETFMDQWENYFFNSYFSHLLNDISPVKGNIVQLWQKLVNNNQDFPVQELKKHELTLKNILR